MYPPLFSLYIANKETTNSDSRIFELYESYKSRENKMFTEVLYWEIEYISFLLVNLF